MKHLDTILDAIETAEGVFRHVRVEVRAWQRKQLWRKLSEAQAQGNEEAARRFQAELDAFER